METIVTTMPMAYVLAERQRGSVLDRFNHLQSCLCNCYGGAPLREFVEFVDQGTVAINMSIGSCARFLESGAWLNIYEAILKEKKVSRRVFQSKVRKRLKEWYLRRRKVERVLRFRRDTHYAALNLGGHGASRYGVCCVLIDTKMDHYCTAFAGDSLRAVFDSNGIKLLNDAEILTLFSVREDAARLAAIRCRSEIESAQPGIDRARIRSLLENSDSLIEIHLHGAVRREHIRAVTMARNDLAHFWDLVQRADKAYSSQVQEFDAVPAFVKMIRLLNAYKLTLQASEAVS